MLVSSELPFMKVIIFAGGVGTRLWPLSRRRSPKQFEKVIGDKSTLQLAVERLLPDFTWKDLYISTCERYSPIIMNLLPEFSPDNFIVEPEPRDVGPAVALVVVRLMKKYSHTPIVILWSDHMIRKSDLFLQILQDCGKLISKQQNKIIFIGQKPRFASQNLGWVEYGKECQEEGQTKFYSFESFHYRPDLGVAEKFYKSGNFAWNVGYFVTTPLFLWKLYEKYQPEMFELMEELYKTADTPKFKSSLKKIFPFMPKISFDNAILEKIAKNEACVISQELGWSDIGAWEALKEALQSSPEQNVTQGKVLLTDCRDSLVYNYTDQMVVTIDINGFLVINTHDVVLICHKNSVPKIKKLVEKLAKSENDNLV